MFQEVTNNISFLLIREWLNGGLFPLSLMLAAILSVHMANAYAVVGRGWTQAPGVSTACVLFWIFSADAWRAFFVWLTLRIINDSGVIPPWLALATTLGFIVTAIMLISAMIRCIYMFTPARLGHGYWVLAVSVTIAFLIISHTAPPFPIN